MKGAREAAWRALVDLEKGRAKRIDAALRHGKLDPRDRSLALELARGVERLRILLDGAIGAFVQKRPRDPHVRVALRLGAYQLLRLTRVPAYAAVGETVALLKGRREASFLNAVLRKIAASIESRPADRARARRELPLEGDRVLVFEKDTLPRDPTAYVALLHGLPGFLVERWRDAYGAEAAEQIAAAASATPEVTLRANARLGDGPALAAELTAEGVETEPLDHPQLLRWTGGSSPFDGAAFEAGWFAVQDPTAVRAAEALGAQPGETVVDLCAGPGTKTMVLAEAVTPGGHVHAYDVSESRRRPIRGNAKRLGHEEVVTVHEDVAALPPADRVLVDVPCSNTGVLARRIEVRHRLTPEVFAELAEQQKELLEQALELVRPGGVVVYSTCSVEPEENDGVVDAVAGAGFTVRERVCTLPDAPRCDGGYFAVIEKAP